MPAFADRAKAIGAQLVFLMGVIEPSNWGVDTHKYPDGISSSVKAIRDRGLQVGLHTLPCVATSKLARPISGPTPCTTTKRNRLDDFMTHGQEPLSPTAALNFRGFAHVGRHLLHLRVQIAVGQAQITSSLVALCQLV
jgi:hypothetical protein